VDEGSWWRETPFGEAHVVIASSEALGGIAVRGGQDLPRRLHLQELLEGGGVEPGRGRAHEQRRFFVRRL